MISFDVLRLIRTVPTARAAAESTFQVMSRCEDQEAVFQIVVGLLRRGFVVFMWVLGWHRVPAVHLASTMMAEPIKMKIPPTITGSCNCPLKSSTENIATNSG